MATTTLHTTTCENCGATQEHTTAKPAGWGRIRISNFDHAGYAVNTRVDAVVCPGCTDKAVEELKA